MIAKRRKIREVDLLNVQKILSEMTTEEKAALVS